MPGKRLVLCTALIIPSSLLVLFLWGSMMACARQGQSTAMRYTITGGCEVMR